MKMKTAVPVVDDGSARPLHPIPLIRIVQAMHPVQHHRLATPA
jgi:hypothetical protein